MAEGAGGGRMAEDLRSTEPVAVRARPVDGTADAQDWSLQTNMEGQP